MDSSKQKADSKHLYSLVKHDLCQPVVFHGLTHEWPARKWTPEDIASVLGEQQVKIRIGLKEAKDWASTQWEASCSYETTTLASLCEWLRLNRLTDKSPDKPQDRQNENPLLCYSPDKYWCYMDYKYMAELFEDHPNILHAIRWSDFGFSGRDGNQSTIWIGSQGATTPGHYDTYGCNLVAQLYGRKKWYLFPPNQSDMLYQTRLPYEESSVFSPINVTKPDLNKYPQFSAATPYIITLEPGDVLFVPRHWWHFVETVETSISVNTWIELDSDHEDRFHEAITRALVSGILPSGTQGNSKWLNPTEELCDATTNMKYIKKALENLTDYQKQMKKQNTKSQPAIHTSHKTSTELDIIMNETTHSHGQVVQESNITFSHNTAVKCDESEEEAVNSTTSCSPAKRPKFVCDSQTSIESSQLPDFVTVIPCLGEVYKQQYKTSSGGNTKEIVFHGSGAQHICNHQRDIENESGKMEIKERTEKTSRDSMARNELHCSGIESSGYSGSPSDTGENETDDVLKILLQSVTHPEVISRIASLMCKKVEEKWQLTL